MERDIIYTANSVSLNPVLWLRADKGVTLVSGKVSNWEDQSGNGYDASQSTANSRPTFENNVLNGKPAIYYDGVDDVMDLSQTFNFSANLTIFAIIHSTALYFRTLNTADGNYAGVDLFSVYYSSLISDVNCYYQSVATTGFNILTVLNNSNYSSLYKNGIQVRSPILNTGTYGYADKLGYLIAPYQSKGYIAELIVYNQALSSSDIMIVEKYLNKKYSIY